MNTAKNKEKSESTRGGYRYDEHGNPLVAHLFKSRWNHTPTKAIRIPLEFYDLISTLARICDNDEEFYMRLKKMAGYKE